MRIGYRWDVEYGRVTGQTRIIYGVWNGCATDTEHESSSFKNGLSCQGSARSPTKSGYHAIRIELIISTERRQQPRCKRTIVFLRLCWSGMPILLHTDHRNKQGWDIYQRITQSISGGFYDGEWLANYGQVDGLPMDHPIVEIGSPTRGRNAWLQIPYVNE